MGPGEKRDWNGKLGQSDGVTANKGPSLGEKGGLAEGRTQAAPGPHRRPEARRRRFLAGAGPLPPGLGGKWGGHSSGRDRGRGPEGEGRRGQPPPRPAVSLATETSVPGRGPREGESTPVATQRPGDVRRLSLVPKVTGRAAGPGTICVCPQRGCGASGVWRSGGNALLARGQAGDGTQRPFQLSEAGDPGGAASAPYRRTPLRRSLPPGFSPHA